MSVQRVSALCEESHGRWLGVKGDCCSMEGGMRYFEGGHTFCVTKRSIVATGMEAILYSEEDSDRQFALEFHPTCVEA
jgi:hypothetical protein